jgi:hypothetical protein
LGRNQPSPQAIPGLPACPTIRLRGKKQPEGAAVTVTTVYKKAKAVTEYLLICAGVAGVIMLGPILQAVGIIKG